MGATGDLGLNRILDLATTFQSGVRGEFILENDEDTGSVADLDVDLGEEPV